MTYFPVFLALAHRRCLVVGGGPIAERKARGLLAAGANVTVVSPTVTAALARLGKRGRIRRVARHWREGDLSGAALVFVATNDGVLNAAVARAARQRRVWVNTADDPRYCDAILPAVLRRGAVTVAVGTGGRSPALARRVRDVIAEAVPKAWGPLSEVAASARRECRRRGHRATPAAWARALDGMALRLAATGRRAAARRRLLRTLGATWR